jgi:hypothetical protein
MSKGPTAALDAPSGFLWKPISDSTGLLVILLPESWSDNAATVTILSSDRQTLLAEGRPAGIGNGGRAHFRFDRPGGDFPPGVLIQVKFSDGSIREITVPSPLMRGEGR